MHGGTSGVEREHGDNCDEGAADPMAGVERAAASISTPRLEESIGATELEDAVRESALYKGWYSGLMAALHPAAFMEWKHAEDAPLPEPEPILAGGVKKGRDMNASRRKSWEPSRRRRRSWELEAKTCSTSQICRMLDLPEFALFGKCVLTAGLMSRSASCVGDNRSCESSDIAAARVASGLKRRLTALRSSALMRLRAG